MNETGIVGFDPARGHDASAITLWMMKAAKQLDLTGVLMSLEEVQAPEGCLTVWNETELERAV